MPAPLSLFLICSVLALRVLGAASNRSVFAHLIFGNTYSFTTQDWEENFELAEQSGFDAFVFDIGTDSWTQNQSDLAFAVATNYTMRIFFSFDFAASPWTTDSVIAILKRYVGKPEHFKCEGTMGDGKWLVSSFDGPAQTNVDWMAVKSAVPDLYVVPHLSMDKVRAKPPGIDGALNWNAWATKNNIPIDGNATTVDDYAMQSLLGDNQTYATIVSPWSFTNYHGYGIDKEWVFKSDDLLVTRWNQMLTFDNSSMGASVGFVEVYSWNDYGESNYVNNISTVHDDAFAGGADAWSKGFKHDGWRLISIPFIKAFKAGHPSVNASHIDTEMVVFYHRPYLANTLCTGQTHPIPGASFVPDQITIVSALNSSVQLMVNSGNQSTQVVALPGIFTNHVPMQLGSQSVTVMRNGTTCGELTSSVEVKDSCVTPNYNANVEYIILNCK